MAIRAPKHLRSFMWFLEAASKATAAADASNQHCADTTKTRDADASKPLDADASKSLDADIKNLSAAAAGLLLLVPMPHFGPQSPLLLLMPMITL